MIALALLACLGLDDDPIEFFEKDVRPVLVGRCQSCHGAEKQKGGLRLDSKAAVLKGGDSGPAVEPGNVAESLLVDAIGYAGDVKMPPRSMLDDREIEVLKRWVERGLPWPEASAPTKVPTEAFDLKARREAHWVWRPVTAPNVPEVGDATWPRGPIDRFVLTKLEETGLHPALGADRGVLLRRLTFDLIGLPPTAEEIQAFLADERTDAYERVVDRLLASPHFGERWARHWLDLVRYAETRGHEFDAVIPNAYQYRDYVIRAWNDDVPYDRLVREHLAGDLLEDPRRNALHGFDESVLGTGFWFLGEEVHSPVDVRQDETDRIDNRLDVFGKTFLGMTIACARCHDHKFDAISQRDYYALTGFLVGGSYRQVRFETRDREHEVAQRLETLREEARARLLPRATRAGWLENGEVGRLLAAAGELLQSAALARPDHERGRLIQEVASRRKLDPARVERWLEEVAIARGDHRHPLHGFARLVAEPDSSDPERFAAHAQALRDEVRRRVKDLESPENVVVDFGEDPRAWRPDGSAYGPRALRLGDLRFGGTPERPALEVIDRAAAYRDPMFESLRTASDNHHDHGRLGEWDRSGLTIRSPEFVVKSGTLWYLVKGPLRAYANVHSHLLIAGPLHGALLHESKGDEHWRWVRHDLAAYKGLRAHLEFSPAGPGPFAIARVLDAAEAPALVEPADLLVDDLLVKAEPTDTEALARAYVGAIQKALGQLRRGTLSREGPPWAAGAARWVVSRLELFDGPDPSLRDEVAEVLRAESEIAGPLRAASRTAPAMVEGNGVDEPLLIRGNSRAPARTVPRRFLEAIAGDDPLACSSETSGRRELAEQVASAANPLTARVFVNRVWHHLFGRGIVASVDNFGVLGERPSHPELLDFLADRFVREGWSTKRLVRMIVLSSTYRMSSRADALSDEKGPDNVLLHRARVRRLQGEALRDAMLLVSGRLDRTQFGPSVPVHLTPFMQGRGKPDKSGPLDGAGRRSLYLEVRRNFLSPFLLAFDTPIPFNTMGRRNVSNVPAQALILLNDPFVTDEAKRWARHTLEGPERTVQARVNAMYRAAFGREATPEEVAALGDFVQGRDDPDVWSAVAHVLFNSKEFLYIP